MYYTYETSSGGLSPAQTWGSLLLAAIIVAGLWKMFVKAKQPGWAALIPVYNLYIILKIVGRPGWWLILFVIPFVNIVTFIIVYNDLAKSFGKGMGTTLLLLFLPFIATPMLGFGGAKYTGPSVAANPKLEA